MKKALVILLTLAVAGGLFAQTFTWSGNFEGGVGMLGGESYDDPVFGLVSPSNGVNGVRTQIELNATNADGNAGFQARLRATSAGDSNNLGNFANASFHTAWGWLKFNDMLTLRAGKHGSGMGMKTPRVDFDLYDNFLGMTAYLTPMGDLLKIGAGVWSQTNLWNDGFTGLTFDDGALGIWGGVQVNLGVADIRAQLTYKEEVVNAGLGVEVTVLPQIPIHAQVRLNNLNEFGDAGEMIAHAFAGVNMIQDLGILIGFGLGMSQADDADMSMAFGAGVSYTLGNIVPSLDLWYVMGGTYNYGDGFGNGAAIGTGNFNKYNADLSYFSVRPKVEIKVTGNTLWTLGCIFNIGLGDASPDGVDYGFFTGARIAF